MVSVRMPNLIAFCIIKVEDRCWSNIDVNKSSLAMLQSCNKKYFWNFSSTAVCVEGGGFVRCLKG